MQGKSPASSGVVVRRHNADGTETTVHVGVSASLSRLIVEEDAVYMEFGAPAASAAPRTDRKTQAQVFEAVAASYKGYVRKDYVQNQALRKAIADNIADVRELGLWRTNRGRSNEGAPGSSVRGCYQALYEKGYLRATVAGG